ncbi:MAG: tetrahydromethanopterin S-methyltransferase subunit A [Candidatus Aureabacteria bacterium]|nr:tetrahydromethanopterin S-methyltransferase subunit A [Candidatus Auribacterota bacterium]
MVEIYKAEPSPEYPPEEGCYLRGNDYSPVAVCVILNRRREETPPDYEMLVRVAVETGAALAGTLQTENIGLEKIILNITANPNIRYLVQLGPESPGHLTGAAIAALMKNGVDARKRIIGSESPTPYLFNISMEHIERFREQVTLVDFLNEGSVDLVRGAVQACYQEEPAEFRGYRLFDPGALRKPPLSGKITWRVTQPEKEPKTEEERIQMEKGRAMVEWVRKKMEEKKLRKGE